MNETQKAIRKAARRRFSLLPGTGFALLGYPVPASLGLVWMVMSLTALAIVSFYPSTVMIWLALAFPLGGMVIGAVEYLAVGRITIRPSGETGPISRYAKGICALAYISTVAASACLILNFRSLVLRGDGMIPVIYPGELLSYQESRGAGPGPRPDHRVPGLTCVSLEPIGRAPAGGSSSASEPGTKAAATMDVRCTPRRDSREENDDGHDE